MANVIDSPNMDLPIPTPTDPGPDYATNVSNALNQIDAHDHSGPPTGGVKINLAQQIIAGDVQFNDYNVGTVRSVEFVNQSGNLTGTQDVNCLYVNQGVLGFNNSSGTFIPLVGQLAASFFNWSAQAVSTNYTIAPNATFNLLACTTTGGPITITLPASATIVPAPQWRLFLIYDVGEDGGTNFITINTAGGDTFASSGGGSFQIQSNGGYIALITDGVSKWYAWDQNTYNSGEVLEFINGGSWSMEAGTIKTASAAITDGNSGITLSGTTIAGSAGVRSGNLVISGPGAVAIDTALDIIETLSALSGSSVTIASGASLYIVGAETIQSGGALTAAAGSTMTIDGAMIVNSVPDFASDVDVGGQAVLAGGIRTSGAPLSYNNPVTVNVAGGSGGTLTLSSSQYQTPIVRITRTSALTGAFKIVFPVAPTVPDGTTWMLDLSGFSAGAGDSGTITVFMGTATGPDALVYNAGPTVPAKCLWLVQVNASATFAVVG